MAEEKKSEEKILKTLANCKNSEFLPQANRCKKLIYDFYEKIDLQKIAAQYREQYQKAATEEISEVSKAFVSEVMTTMLEKYPVDTISVIAALGFMTFEEADEADPSDLLAIGLQCMSSRRVMDFFINVAALGGKDTVGILQVLISIKRIFGEKSTSEKESSSNTENTSTE